MDFDRIIGDLIRMREEAFGAEGQRRLGRKAKISYGKIQRLEAGERKTLSIQDMDAILTACGSSLALYFQQDLTFDEARIIDEDRALLIALRRALKTPRHRKKIRAVIEIIADEDARFARLRKQ